MSREQGLARARRIRKMHADGVSGVAIAREFGINRSAVYDILQNDRFPEAAPKVDGAAAVDVANLTPSRRLVYEYLVIYLRDYRIPPTIREVAESLDHSINHVHKVLMYLCRHGLIERVHGIGRARCWVPTVRDVCPCCRRPLVQSSESESSEVSCGAN